MRPENKKFLDDNRHHYDLLVKAQVVKHLDMATRTNLLKVIHEEFNPAYLGQLWCQSCVADMISFAYTQYDKANDIDQPVNGDDPSLSITGADPSLSVTGAVKVRKVRGRKNGRGK